MKLHYPSKLIYEDNELNINNREVYKEISNILGNYAFIIRSFEYETDDNSLNFDALIVGENNIPYSKVFINEKGVGNKFNVIFNENADDYDREIIALKKEYGDEVNPYNYLEFTKKLNDVIYVSATPGDYEMERVNNKVVEQIIRPTGLLDPLIEVRPTKNQIDNLVEEINKQIEKNERTLITTLTIRMAEELTNYLKSLDIKVAYLHSEVKTLERLKIIRDLRLGKYDVVVGINLLREGIDIPEVSLIAIMDADKQGFLRSTRSLIQTIGRAARNSSGRVIMYADIISDSMNEAITETERRRNIQEKYNKEHGIIPKTIIKDIPEVISNETEKKVEKESKLSKKEKLDLIDSLTKEMKSAASNLDFERAMELRDIIFDLENDK